VWAGELDAVHERLVHRLARSEPRESALADMRDWDADEVLDDVRDYVVEHLGDPGAVLIVDDNCQIGVFLSGG
jgi:SRSO17 transposase